MPPSFKIIFSSKALFEPYQLPLAIMSAEYPAGMVRVFVAEVTVPAVKESSALASAGKRAARRNSGVSHFFVIFYGRGT